MACCRIFIVYIIQLIFMQPVLAQNRASAQPKTTYRDDYTALLYLHTDKTIYTNNETVWFSAYLVHGGEAPIAQHKFLLASLVREDDNRVVMHQKFILQNGMGNGNITLPDSIAPGNYKLMAYTDVVNSAGKPLDVFVQHLTVRSLNQPAITAGISLVDTLADEQGNYHVILYVQPRTISKKLKPEVSYHIGSTAGKTVTQDALGKYEMLIPAKKVTSNDAVLYTAIKYDKEFKYLSIKLPKPAPALNVRFYPEGGNISGDMLNMVGLETKMGNAPFAIQGVLLKDNVATDTIRTNSAGLARFPLYCDAGSVYTFKLLNSVKDGAIYPLPAAVNSKLVLTLARAVCDDTVRFKVMSAIPQRVRIVISDHRQEYFSFNHALKAGRNQFAVDVYDMPKGAGMVTVLDSLGRPLAGRLFFANYNRRVTTEIKIDKPQYAKREKVTVTISLTDAVTHQPVGGMLSVAAVQGNRLEATKQQNLDSYAYLTHDLADSTVSSTQLSLTNKANLEDNLLVRGWRRQTWKDTASKPDSLHNSLAFTGYVTRDEKRLKKPIKINVMGEGVAETLLTDSAGRFKVDAGSMYAAYDSKIMLFAAAANRDRLHVEFTDPYRKLSDTVALNTSKSLPVDFQANTAEGYDTGLKKTRQLKQVDIKANRDGSIYAAKKVSNDCGDYVCFFNILNCPNHPSGSLPVVGAFYSTMRAGRMERVIYKGCDAVTDNGAIKIDGIYAGKEFYGLQPAELELSNPEYISTLYWNPSLVVSENGTVSFSFYNGDITGTFRIIVQGVTGQALVSAAERYEVK